MKNVKIIFTDFSKRDYESLPIELVDECRNLLIRLSNAGKKLGIPLENKNGRDLRGFYKLYFDNAKYRIVYTVKEFDGEEVIEIVGIGERQNEYIYKLIYNRKA